MDQELREYLDRRFDGVETRLDKVEARLDGLDSRFDGMDTRLDGMDSRFDGMDRRFDQSEIRQDQTDERLEQLARDTEKRFTDVDDQLRHTHVVVEGLQSKIEAVAEGVLNVDEKLDRSQIKMDHDLREVRSQIRISYVELERRINGIEASQARHERDKKQFEERLTALEALAS